MTPVQRAMARHALGLPNPNFRSYRNRYYVHVTTEPARAWRDMVDMGLAMTGRGKAPYVWFHLTRLGAEAALEQGESLCPEDFPPQVVS